MSLIILRIPISDKVYSSIQGYWAPWVCSQTNGAPQFSLTCFRTAGKVSRTGRAAVLLKLPPGKPSSPKQATGFPGSASCVLLLAGVAVSDVLSLPLPPSKLFACMPPLPCSEDSAIPRPLRGSSK